MSPVGIRTDGFHQWRLRWIWVTAPNRYEPEWVVWLQIGGRKPLGHLPTWRRRLLHLPSIRIRLWPRPFRKYVS